MLLQFAVENFRSFREEAVLNLIPAKSRIHPDHVLGLESKGPKVKALPLAVLYGANASGKSNLIRAADFASGLIVEGTRAGEPTGAQPFLLDPEWAARPSRFEFVFKHEDVLYTYGFVVSPQEVVEEWLYAVFQKQEVRIFERTTEAGRTRVQTGRSLAKRRIQFVAEGTRPNQLFLTEAFERNVSELEAPMQWFRKHLVIIWPEARFGDLIPRIRRDSEFAAFLSQFLRAVDTGIQGIRPVEALDTQTVRERLSAHLRGLPDALKDVLLAGENKDHFKGTFSDSESFLAVVKEGQEPEWVSLQAEHQSSSGETIAFPIGDESDGTRRMMHLAPALFLARSRQVVYLIDELDRSLHPMLCRLFIESFLAGIKQENVGCQLVLSTHEMSLLDLELLRRDEIWFLQKSTEGASKLYSLAEFKANVRADLNIAKGYLNGRFGGVPLIRRSPLGI